MEDQLTSAGEFEDVVDVNGLDEVVVALEPGVALVPDPSDVVAADERPALEKLRWVLCLRPIYLTPRLGR